MTLWQEQYDFQKNTPTIKIYKHGRILLKASCLSHGKILHMSEFNFLAAVYVTANYPSRYDFMMECCGYTTNPLQRNICRIIDF